MKFRVNCEPWNTTIERQSPTGHTSISVRYKTWDIYAYVVRPGTTCNSFIEEILERLQILVLFFKLSHTETNGLAAINSGLVISILFRITSYWTFELAWLLLQWQKVFPSFLESLLLISNITPKWMWFMLMITCVPLNLSLHMNGSLDSDSIAKWKKNEIFMSRNLKHTKKVILLFSNWLILKTTRGKMKSLCILYDEINEHS